MDDFQDMQPSKASNNNLKASHVTFVQIYACNQRNIQCSILSIFKKVISLQLKRYDRKSYQEKNSRFFKYTRTYIFHD